jgi:two-component system, NtrC family, response regulator AtoC
MEKKNRVLIVDDEADLRSSVISMFQQELPQVICEQATNGLEAVEKVENHFYDLIIMDVKMPQMDGLSALHRIKSIDPRTFVVILTAHTNVRDAIDAIKEGAFDYLEKPIQRGKLIEIYKKSQEAKELVEDVVASLPIFDDDINTDFVGESQKMREVFNLVYKVCKVDTTVLIRGENGTGKELVARAVHYNSHRKLSPFIAINCAALAEGLIESELFGHEKGAFTGADERKIGKFQLANDGTLFLDEIAELKPETQVKLLRVLQEKKFNPVGSNRELVTSARIVTATNQNLEKMILEGRFREDLYYRLNVMPIFLPPLRERLEDIENLTLYFLKKFSEKYEKPIPAVDPVVLQVFKKHLWPGNIRELENLIERFTIMNTDGRLSLSQLPENFQNLLNQDANAGTALNFEKFKEDAERDFIINALKVNSGKINQTVANANIPKNTLLRKIKKFNINPKDYSKK